MEPNAASHSSGRWTCRLQTRVESAPPDARAAQSAWVKGASCGRRPATQVQRAVNVRSVRRRMRGSPRRARAPCTSWIRFSSGSEMRTAAGAILTSIAPPTQETFSPFLPLRQASFRPKAAQTPTTVRK